MSDLRLTLVAAALVSSCSDGLDTLAPCVPGREISLTRLEVFERAGVVMPTQAKLGRGLANVGDIDGDGIDDLAIGAPGLEHPGSYLGEVFLTFMRPDGSVRDVRQISTESNRLDRSLPLSRPFGLNVAGIGDVDHDGVLDIAVGLPLDGAAGTRAGAIQIIALNRDGSVKSHWRITTNESGFTFPLSVDGRFGSSVSALPDLDGDGNIELVVGQYLADDARGAIWVLKLDDRGHVQSALRTGSGTVGFDVLLDSGDRFGVSTAPLGDLDGDGTFEVAVGAHGDDDDGEPGGIGVLVSDRGAVYILSLDRNGAAVRTRKLVPGEGAIAGGGADFDSFGIQVATLGDLDANGVVDLGVAVTGDDAGAGSQGSLRLIFLDETAQAIEAHTINGASPLLAHVLEKGDEFGTARWLGDTNGDGFPELAVAAFSHNADGMDAGAVWRLSLESANSSQCVPVR